MSTRITSRIHLLSALSLAAVAIAACSGGTVNPASSGPASSEIPTGATLGTAPTTTSPATGIDICALLPAAEVAQLTGLTIGAATPRVAFFGPTDLGCVYGANDAVIDVVSPGGAAFYADTASQYDAANLSPIAGFGDKAFQDFTDGSGFIALFGDSAYDVYFDNPAKTDAEINQASETLVTSLRAKM
jgi:hypothetical protein